MAKFLGKSRGPTTLKLAMHDLEPTADFLKFPVHQWASRAWEGQHDKLMHQAWYSRVRARRQAGEDRSTRDPQGPVEAVEQALAAAGWGWPTPFALTTKEGQNIDMRHFCPMDVQALVMQAVEDETWKAWAAEGIDKELSPRPFLQPIKAWAKRARNSAEVGFVRKLVRQGQVTQQTLHSWGWAEEAECQACNEAPGTEGHRLYECKAFHLQRQRASHRK